MNSGTQLRIVRRALGAGLLLLISQSVAVADDEGTVTNTVDRMAEYKQALTAVPDHPGLWARLSAEEAARGYTGFSGAVARMSLRIQGKGIPDLPAGSPVIALELAELRNSLRQARTQERPLSSEQWARAEAVLLSQVNVEPHGSDLWTMLAEGYELQGDAVATLVARHERLLRLPGPGPHWEAAYLDDLEEMGLRGLLIREVRRLRPATTDDETQLFAAAERLSRHQAWSDVEPYVLQLRRLRPDSGEVWMMAGNLALEMQQPADAERAFSQALKLFENPVEAWKSLALLSARQRDIEGTLIWLQKLREKLSEADLIELLMDPAFHHVPQVLERMD